MQRGWWATAAVASIVAATPVCASEPRLAATAGVGGVARAGRWVPIVASLEATDGPLDGELIATWGESVARRTVTLPASSRLRVDLHLRALDPRETIRVELRTASRAAVSLDLPVRLLPADADAALCIGQPGTASEGPACAAWLTPGELPRSPRGFDAIDRVVWHGPRLDLDLQQREALDAWQRTRDLVTSGRFGQSPRPAPFGTGDPDSRALPILMGAGGLAYIGLLVVVLTRTARQSRVALSLAAIAVVVGAGSVAARAVGHAGPASAIRIRHATTVRQLDAARALVSMRGQVTFPAFDRYRLTAGLLDGAIVLDAYPRRVSEDDEDGRPIIDGSYALGAVQPFELEGTVAFAPFSVERAGDRLHLANVSTVWLRACRFTDGLDARETGDLPPGGRLDVRATEVEGLPVVACHVSSVPVSLSESGHDVRLVGDAIVSIALTGVEEGAA